MSDRRIRALERARAAGDPGAAAALAQATARSRGCCGRTGWSGPWDRCDCGCSPDLAVVESWLPPVVDRIDDQLSQWALEEARDRWLKIGLATGPTDMDLAKAGISAAYREAGLEPPRLWVRLQDPMRGAIGAAMLKTRNP